MAWQPEARPAAPLKNMSGASDGSHAACARSNYPIDCCLVASFDGAPQHIRIQVVSGRRRCVCRRRGRQKEGQAARLSTVRLRLQAQLPAFGRHAACCSIAGACRNDQLMWAVVSHPCIPGKENCQSKLKSSNTSSPTGVAFSIATSCALSELFTA